MRKDKVTVKRTGTVRTFCIKINVTVSTDYKTVSQITE